MKNGYLLAGIGIAAIICASFAHAQMAAPAQDSASAQTAVQVSAPPSAASATPTATDANTAPARPQDPDVVAALPNPNMPVDPQNMSPIEKEISEQIAYLNPSVNVNNMPSLFFSVWEHDLVTDARRGLNTRTPMSEDGIAEAGPRDVSLGGIVFVNNKEWTIWLNSMRVSPSAIPDQVMDLKVYKEYIELEWFDETTNQIFPIRLRPHQRFNLDTRIFLPG